MDEPQAPSKQPVGRPTDYSLELAAKFCAELACGTSVMTICLDESMPCRKTIYLWLAKHEEFLHMYTRAKEDGADAIFDETLDIADDGSNDWMDIRNNKGEVIKTVVDKEAVMRSKLRVETRKWYLSKIKPKKYGEAVLLKNQQLDKKGDPTDPVSADSYLADALELARKVNGHTEKP